MLLSKTSEAFEGISDLLVRCGCKYRLTEVGGEEHFFKLLGLQYKEGTDTFAEDIVGILKYMSIF